MKLRQDNRGISVVEIIIVITIMVIVGSGMFLGINMLVGKPSQKCATKIVSTLERHRTTAMGKVDAEYKLSKNTEGDIIVTETVQSKAGDPPTTTIVPVGDNRLSIYCTINGAEKEITDTDVLTLQFQRGSGGFRPQAAGGYCTQIRIIQSNNASTEYIIELEQLTGKARIKQ